MKSKFLFLLLASSMVILFTACPKTKQTTSGGVFTVTDEKGTATKKGPEVVGTVNIKTNIAALSDEKNDTVTLPLPGNKSVKLQRKRLDRFDNGRYAWYGVATNDPGSFVLISITSKAIAGKLTTSKGEIYMINYTGKGIYSVDQINGNALPERKDDDIEAPVTGHNAATERDCPDPATQVDIMMLYTADAETGAGGPEGMEAFLYLCIYYTNLSYQNSNVNLTMHLVHFAKVTYTETGNENTDLTNLQGTADGQMDNIHALRDAHGADLVSMITETMGGCGLAYRQYPVTAAWEVNAFSVVKRTCAAAGLSFAHETAHNMGARHDCANASNLPDPNHGHFVSAPADGSGSSWRTVMSYNSCTAGPCTRIPFYSNPLLNYSPTGAAATDPLGTAAAAGVCTDNNQTVLNNAAAIVANFRCSSPGVSNVWMRDTWDDTGLEPDPATSGQQMWRSPYIWIRHSAQDPTFLHQHEHENPVMGEPNWIYVKLHNGGVADNGTLDVYIANASVSLTWPGAWTLVSSVPVTMNAASTRIVEIPWNTVPGIGHYCMIARYNSAADAVTGETADIGNNTRAHNNIVWRNLNVVEMDPDEDEKKEVFNVQADNDRAISIKLTDEALFPKHAFTETGRIFINLGDTLYAAWKKGGSKGTGIKVTEREIEVTSPNASLDNIVLFTKGKQPATIRFVKTKNTISDLYHFTVSQTDAGGKVVFGGVSYEIAAFRR